jgi:hypothetical protein
MSKTTKIKIPTRIMTTYLPCLDTTMTIKSYPLFFGEESVYFGEPRGEEVPHSVRLADTAVEQQGRRSLSPANGIYARSFRLDTDPLEAPKHTESLERVVCLPSAFQRSGVVPAGGVSWPRRYGTIAR